MSSQPLRPRPIWDLPVRVFHWLLAPAIAVMWWSGESGEMQVHQWTGYGLLCLVLTRVMWGFVGSEGARFSSFVRGPAVIRAYLSVATQSPGHNPLGALSVLAFLALLAAQALSGLASRDDLLFEGPFAYWAGDWSAKLTEWHELNWTLLQALIVLHLAAVAFLQWRRGQPLIQAMWRGHAGSKKAEQLPKPAWRALVILFAWAALLWWLILVAPQAPSYY